MLIWDYTCNSLNSKQVWINIQTKTAVNHCLINSYYTPLLYGPDFYIEMYKNQGNSWALAAQGAQMK